MSLYDDYLNELNRDDDEEVKVSLYEQYETWQTQTPAQRAATQIEQEKKEKPPLIERVKEFGRGIADIFKKPVPPEPTDIVLQVEDKTLTTDDVFLNVVEQDMAIGGEIEQTKEQLIESYLREVKENPMLMHEKTSYAGAAQFVSPQDFKDTHYYVLNTSDDELRRVIRERLEKYNYQAINISEAGGVSKDKETRDLQKQYRSQVSTAKMYSQIVNEGTNDGDFREAMAEGFAVPIVTTIRRSADLWDLATASWKNARGEELTAGDKAVLELAAAKDVEAILDPKGWGYVVGSILREAPAFMGEYGLTRFIATGVSGAVRATPAVTKIASKAPFLGKLIGGLAGVTAQTTVGFAPRILEQDLIYATRDMEFVFGEEGEILVQSLDAETDLSEAMLKNLPKAYANIWIEIASESSGEALRSMKQGLLIRFFNKHPVKSTAKGAELLAKFGWHGVIEEVLEEEIAYLGQTKLEGEEIKLPIVTQEGTERLILETMGIGLLGTVMTAPTNAYARSRYNSAVKEMHRIGKQQGLSEEQVDTVITDIQEAAKVETAVTPVEEPAEPAPEAPAAPEEPKEDYVKTREMVSQQTFNVQIEGDKVTVDPKDAAEAPADIRLIAEGLGANTYNPIGYFSNEGKWSLAPQDNYYQPKWMTGIIPVGTVIEYQTDAGGVALQAFIDEEIITIKRIETEVKGEGIGTEVLAGLKRVADNTGKRLWFISVDEDTAPFYEKAGLIKDGDAFYYDPVPVAKAPVTPAEPAAPAQPAEAQQLINEAKVLGRAAYQQFLKDNRPRVPAQDAKFMEILKGVEDSGERVALMKVWADAYSAIPDAEAAEILKEPVAEIEPFTDRTGIPSLDDYIENPEVNTAEGKYFRDYQKNYKGRVAEVVQMSPDAYLNELIKHNPKYNSVDDIIARSSKENITKFADAMKKGDKFNMPYISIGEYQGETTFTQEGIHRVLAAKEIGVKTMPVLVEKSVPKPKKKPVTKTAQKKVEAKKKKPVEKKPVEKPKKKPITETAKKKKPVTKTYVATVDQHDPRREGEYWMSGTTRKLTEAEAKPLIEAGKAREQTEEETKPKRFVDIKKPDGTIERITWGEYLKRRAAERKKREKKPEPKVVKPEGKGVSELVSEDKDSVKYQVLTKYGEGKDLKDLTAKQIGDVLSEGEGLVVNYSEELAKKFGSITRAIDTLLIEDRPVFIYGGVSQNVFSDGFLLILNQTAAKEFNEKNIKRFTDKERKRLMKETGISYEEAQKIAEAEAEEGIKEMGEKYPAYEQIIPKRSDLEKGEIVGITASGNNPEYILKSKNHLVIADADKMQFMEKTTGYDSLYIAPDKPILLYKHDTKQGLVMPMKTEDLGAYRRINDSYKEKKPTKAHSSIGLADLGGYDLDIKADVQDVTLEELNKNLDYLPPRVEFPELIRIIKNLMGEVPSVKAPRRKGLGVPLGTFYAKETGAKGRGRMNLHPLIFRDAQLMGRVSSHELGHLTDYLPQPTMAKGNLLGRITSLREFMRKQFTGLEKESQLKMLEVASARLTGERSRLRVDDKLPEGKKSENAKLLEEIKALNKKIKDIKAHPLLKQEDIHKELSKMTQAWKPFPEILDNKQLGNLMRNNKWTKEVALAKWEQYVAYRYSGVEMYGDAISVLFNEPALLREVAPEFYKGFFQYLNQKPDARDNFFAIWDLITRGADAVASERQKAIRAMFEKGEDISRANMEEEKMRDNRYTLRFQLDHIDRNSAAIEKVREVQKRGEHIPDEQNPEYALAAHNYVGGVVKNFIEENIQPLYEMTKAHDLVWEDVGEVLFLQRVIEERGDIVNPVGWIRENKPVQYDNIKGKLPSGIEKKSTTDQLGELKRLFGDSIDLSTGTTLYQDLTAGMPLGLANPLGMTSETSQAQLDYLKKSLGAEKWYALQEIVKGFRKATDIITEMAKAEGLWKPDLIKLIEANPAYATFQVLDYMEDFISARISHQIGTLKDIANPADASVMKMVSIIRAVERNKVKRSIVDFWAKHFPEEIQEAKYIFTGKARVPVPPRDKKLGLLTVVRNGRLKAYYMDKYVTETIQNISTGEMNVIARGFQIANSRLFRPLFITWNLGFQTFNLKRDFDRFYKSFPDMTVGRALRAYLKAVPASVSRGWDIPDETIAEMEKSKILTVTHNDIIRGATTEDKRIDIILAKASVTPLKGKQRSAIVKKIFKVLDFIGNTGDFVETLPKVAAYNEYKGVIPTQKLAHTIRTKAGSPDFLTKGKAYNVTNNIFLFSNAITQGIRSDISTAIEPETRGGYWLRTLKVNIMPKVIMWAGLLGLFGDKIKEMLEDVSEYDKTNYIIVPLGEDENGKTIYVRIPQDESGRLISGIFWKALRASNNNQPIMQDIGDILSFTGGQLPSLSPAISAIFAAGQYAAGQNPYDFFRNRPVIPEKEFEAGGTYALKPFINWELQQLGLGTIWRGYVSQQAPETKGWVQKVGETPIISNIWGRWIKVSDYGKTEANRQVVTNERRERARRLLEERNLLDDAVREYRDGTQSIARRASIERGLVKDVVGNAPYSGTRKAKVTNTKKKFRIAIIKGTADANLTSLIYANTNAEKKALLREIKEDMTSAEYIKLKRLLIEEKIVSENVFKELRRE